MTQVEPTKSFAPAPMHTVSPHLVCAGAAAAIDFYKRAFGALEIVRVAGPDGKLMHAGVMICGSSVMLVDENPSYAMLGPKALGGTPVTIHLYVSDVDAVMAQAEKAGAKVIMPAGNMFWGDRYGQIEDPFGHHWSIATPFKDVSAEELQDAANAAMGCSPASPARVTRPGSRTTQSKTRR